MPKTELFKSFHALLSGKCPFSFFARKGPASSSIRPFLTNTFFHVD
jgi:hypothetical protein